MRKRVIGKPVDTGPQQESCLDLERLATVEVTSETEEHPIEAALLPGQGAGWQAAEAGEQLIRILFDQPLPLRQIRLIFEENERHRTQEFALRWSSDGGRTYKQIVRQQYNFAPPESGRQVEDYRVALEGVTTLELTIVPDISGGGVCASLAQLRLA